MGTKKQGRQRRTTGSEVKNQLRGKANVSISTSKLQRSNKNIKGLLLIALIILFTLFCSWFIFSTTRSSVEDSKSDKSAKKNAPVEEPVKKAKQSNHMKLKKVKKGKAAAEPKYTCFSISAHSHGKVS